MTADQSALVRTLLRCLGVLAVVSAFVWPALPCLLAAVVLLVGADLFHPHIKQEDS